MKLSSLNTRCSEDYFIEFDLRYDSFPLLLATVNCLSVAAMLERHLMSNKLTAGLIICNTYFIGLFYHTRIVT